MKFIGRYLYAERITAVYGSGPSSSGEWIPAVDVFETSRCFYLVAEVAGVKEEDLAILVRGDNVSLKGRRPLMKEGKALETCSRIEISYGTFERTFTLPGCIEETNVETILKDGVFTVKMYRLSSPP
jgi:HSP20 family protein